jgi:hypothetical protein
MSVREKDCLRALVKAAHPLAVNPVVLRRRPWASNLFVGERLTVGVSSDHDDMLDLWLAALSEIDLPVRYGFVASTEVIARDAGRATLDLLLIDAD